MRNNHNPFSYISVIFRVFFYMREFRKKDLDVLFDQIEVQNSRRKYNLEPYGKVIRKFQKVLRIKKPCLVRCIVISELAVTMNLKIRFYVGMNQSDKEDLHSWIYIEDELFLDSHNNIDKYTILIERIYE